MGDQESMESSRTESGTNWSNTERSCEEDINSFRKFGLIQEGKSASMNGSKNSVSCSAEDNSSHDKLAATQVRIEKEKERSSKLIDIEELPFSEKTELSAGNPVEDLKSAISPAENHNPSILEQSPLTRNYQSVLFCSGNNWIHGYRDFIPARGSQFLDGNHRIRVGTVMGNQDSDGNYLTNGYRIFRPKVKNGGYMSNKIANPDGLPYQVQQNSGLKGENYFMMMARTLSGSEELQRLLEQGDQIGIQRILDCTLGSMFELMTHDNGHHVFGMLVEKCRYDQLQLIVNKADSEPDRFLDAVLTEKGSKSIRKLIKRVKRVAPMAITITNIFRRRSFELLTHRTASHVVRQCFLVFGEEPVLLFLESIAPRLLDLATDRVGCISVNNFLDSITGEARIAVLDYLADHSLFLSNDPSGNFVVQYLLDLNNKEVTETILRRLAGNFEQLAQKQGGSHVLEKLMRYSELGLKTVIFEISKNGKGLLRLARDQFGNYVIQTALKQAKMMSDRKLYTELLDALKPNYPHLMGKTRGRHVAELIKDDLAFQMAKSDE